MQKLRRILSVAMVMIILTIMPVNNVMAKVDYTKNTSFKNAKDLSFPSGFKYAQGMCINGNKMYLAYRNDSGQAKIQIWDMKKKKLSTRKETFSIGHANSMTYCKTLGGIVVATADGTTKIKVISIKDWTVKTIDIGVKNYAVGYSKELGLVVGISGTEKFCRFKIDKKGNVKKIKNAGFTILKKSGYEHQGMEVVGNKVYIVQDLVDSKKTTSDLSKHYKSNRILCYNIQYNKSKKKWGKKLSKAVKCPGTKYDCEFEEIAYCASKGKFFVFANKNFDTRKPLLYASKKL